FGDTPTGNHYGPPSTSFWRRQPPFGGGCAPARYARLRSAAPEGGLGGARKSNLQKEFYTPLHSAFCLLHSLHNVALGWLGRMKNAECRMQNGMRDFHASAPCSLGTR